MISITDGQIFLEPDLFYSGVRPAVNVGHLRVPRGRQRADQGHEEGRGPPPPGPGPVPRARGVRAVRLRPGRGDAAAARARRAHRGDAEAAAVPADGGGEPGRGHLRRHQRLPGRGAGRSGCGAWERGFHEFLRGAASGGRAGDPLQGRIEDETEAKLKAAIEEFRERFAAEIGADAAERERQQHEVEADAREAIAAGARRSTAPRPSPRRRATGGVGGQAREIRRRIRSVENTRQITRTMELVATSKLKRATDRVYAARPYAERLGRGDRAACSTPSCAERYPASASARARCGAAAVLLLTANRGLAGAFNANLIREARERCWTRLERTAWSRAARGRQEGDRLLPLPRASPWRAPARTSGTIPPWRTPASLIEPLVRARSSQGELDAVYVVHAQFRSAMSTPPGVGAGAPGRGRRGRADGRRSAELHPVAVRRHDPRAAAAPLRAQRRVHGAGGERGASRARGGPR